MIFLSDWAFSDATQNTYNLSFTKPNHPNRAAWSDSSDRDIHVVNVSLCLPTVRVMTGLHTYMITVYVFMVTSDVCLWCKQIFPYKNIMIVRLDLYLLWNHNRKNYISTSPGVWTVQIFEQQCRKISKRFSAGSQLNKTIRYTTYLNCIFYPSLLHKTNRRQFISILTTTNISCS